MTRNNEKQLLVIVLIAGVIGLFYFAEDGMFFWQKPSKEEICTVTVENFLTAQMNKPDLDADTPDHFAGYIEYCEQEPKWRCGDFWRLSPVQDYFLVGKSTCSQIDAKVTFKSATGRRITKEIHFEVSPDSKMIVKVFPETISNY